MKVHYKKLNAHLLEKNCTYVLVNKVVNLLTNLSIYIFCHRCSNQGYLAKCMCMMPKMSHHTMHSPKCSCTCWLTWTKDDGAPLWEEASGESGVKKISFFEGLKITFDVFFWGSHILL